MAPALLGFGGFALWLMLALFGGGVDFGRPAVSDPGAWRAAAASLALGAPLAALLVWRNRHGAVWRSGPFVVTAAALAGLVLWSALSIGWALAPDQAWIEANRFAIYAVALVVGAALADLHTRTPRLLALALTAGGVVVALRALAAETFPTQLGNAFEFGRLSTPLGAPNSLATVIALALPGLVWWAGRRGSVWWPALAGAAAVPLLVSLALTLSRSGYLAALVALALGLIGCRSRLRAAVALAVAAICAALPIWYGLSSSALTDDQIAAATREDPGLRLAAALVVATLAAAALTALALHARRPMLGLAVGALALAALAPTALADRHDRERDAIANEPGRVLTLSSNNRLDWWAEAVAGWRERPLAGNGAGSFSLVHLRERGDGEDRFNVGQPHQMVLKVLSDLGLVGLALLLAAAAGTAWAIGRCARGPDREWLLAAAIVLAFAAAAQLDVGLSVPALAVPAFAAVGALLGVASRGPARAFDRRLRGPLAGFGALLVFIAAGSALAPLWANERLRSAESALRSGDAERALELSADARRWNPITTVPLDTAASAHRDRGDLPSMIAALEAATELQPDNARAWRRLAQVLQSLDDPRAGAAWRRVLALDPHNRGAAAAGIQPEADA